MLANIDAILNGASAESLGLDAPFRTTMSSETQEPLGHQKKFIGAIASYKAWKGSQENNGEGISFSNRKDRQAYIQAGATRKERWQRRANVALLQLAGN